MAIASSEDVADNSKLHLAYASTDSDSDQSTEIGNYVVSACDESMKELKIVANVSFVSTDSELDYQSSDHEQLMKHLRSAQSVDEGVTVISMDFHPSHQTLLVFGCSNGEITLWEVGLQQWLGSKPFKVWEMTSCSMPFQAAFVKDSSMSVSRVSWSPDGNLIGIAFTKHLVQLYAYQGSAELRQHLEIDAHAGCVNDLAFSRLGILSSQLCVVTCGDDKLIKIWDLSGKKLSICPHQKENIQFIFSTAVDGKIKAWLYDNIRSRVDYDALGQWCTTMLYSDDGNRLFFCGTSKDGESFLVEWNESEGAIKRTYYGFRKKSAGIVQFDTTRNHFLAVGEDNQIKFWDIVDEAEFSMKSGPNKKPGFKACDYGNNMIMVTAFEVYADSHKKREHRCRTYGKVFGSPTQHNYSYKVTLRTRCFFKRGIMIRYQITEG